MSAERLAALIVEAQPCVVLTGAGVSTESGIPDFRSRTGHLGAVRPDGVRDDRGIPARPGEGLGLLLETAGRARGGEPNAAHLALAELERRGLVEAVVTQNVDRLHHAAGSRNVIEVHGSIRTASCLSAATARSSSESLAAAARSGVRGLRRRAQARRRHVRRAPPAARWRRRSRSLAGAACCSSSARRSRSTRSRPCPRTRSGGRPAGDRQPRADAYDRRADLKIDASAGETLAAAVDALQ